MIRLLDIPGAELLLNKKNQLNASHAMIPHIYSKNEGFNACLSSIEGLAVEVDASILKKIAIDALKCETNSGIPYKKIRIICDAIANSKDVFKIVKICPSSER